MLLDGDVRVDAVVGDALVPGGEPDQELLPGEVRAEAAVRAGAECQVPLAVSSGQD
jgi:hypothetical protein